MRVTHLLMIGAAAVLAAAACADGPGVEPTPVVASVAITPGGRALQPGDTTRLRATVLDAAGHVLTDVAVLWSSRDTTVASVTAAGLVRARAVGRTTIVARAEHKTDTAWIAVEPVLAPVARVDVSPDTLDLAPGGRLQLFATARDADGNELLGRALTWSSDRTDIATVADDGWVTAHAEGRAVVTAVSEGRAGSARIGVVRPASHVARVDVDPASLVLEEGAEYQLRATPRDANGQEITGRAVLWTSADESIATVSAGGLVVALRPGAVAIRARVEGTTGTGTVAVTADYAFDLLYEGWNGVPGESSEVFALDITDSAGVPARMLPAGVRGTDPTPSPDGRQIAFVALNAANNTDLWVVNRDGSGLRQLTAGPEDDAQPAWSPDGSQIAFRRWPAGQGPDIWVVDAGDGGNATNLTADLGATAQHSPAWSPRMPDGSYRIAYSHAAGGRAHIHSMLADGGDKQAVTTTADVYDDQPSWSPDGQMIAFQRFGKIYRVNVSGTGERMLVNLPMFQFAPAWSPDGRLIAFANATEIYTVRPDGSRLARRTFDAVSAERRNPAWLPRVP